MILTQPSKPATPDKDVRTFQRKCQDFLPQQRDHSRALVSHGGWPDSERDRRVGRTVMNRDQTLRYETFLKIRDFGSAHPQEFPDGSAAQKAFETVAAAASTIEAHATAVAQVQAEGKRVKALARAEIADRLALIARTTREASVDDTPDVEPAPTPKLRTDVALLSAARAFINNGQAAVERLVPLGLAPTLLTELQAQVERFEQAARATGHVKALLATERAGIAAALAAGTRAIQRLNVIVTNTFAQNPVQLTEWKRVRRVYRKPKASGAPKASATPTMVAVPTAAPGQPETGAAPQPGNAPPAASSDEPLKRAS